MGKKKVKTSGFWVFRQEFIENNRHKYKNLPTSEQWTAIVSPHWKKLTKEEREFYKIKAKEQPSKEKDVPPERNCHGVLLTEVDRAAREAAEKQKYMEEKVNSIVEEGFLKNDIRTRPFILMMADYFCKTSDGQYPPAEVAVMKFSFENAILKQYHTFVDPGALPLGCAADAKKRSTKTHRLEPPPTQTLEPPAEAKVKEKYDRIYGEILDVLDVRVGQTFSQDNPKRPCVFVRKQDVEMIESVLNQLSDGQWRQTFDVFHLELLFNKLKNKVNKNPGPEPIPVSVTNVFIERDRYGETPNIACDFHEEKDAAKHCALSYVKRWFFLFADHICERIGVQLVAGKHLPANAAIGPQQPPQSSRHDDDAATSSAPEPKRAKVDRSDDEYGANSKVLSAYNNDDSDSPEEEDY